MENEKLNIVELKEALKTIVDISVTIDKDLEDNKLSLMEKIDIAIKSIKLISVIKNIKVIWAQYKDLDDEEKAELITYFKEKFDLRNDLTEEIIERIFEAIINLQEIIGDLK